MGGLVLSTTTLLGDDGFKYSLNGALGLWGGGTSDGRLTGAYGPNVNSGSYAHPTGQVYGLLPELAGRQFETLPGPKSYGVISSRKVFSPTSGGFLRILDSFTNTYSFPLTVPVHVPSYLYSGIQNDPGTDLRVVVPPLLNGYTYAVTDSTLCCYPVVAHVFAGPNAALTPSSTSFGTTIRRTRATPSTV